MTFFPAGFDPRADVVGLLSLVQVDAADGLYGFLAGSDGIFVDTTGFSWWGSTLFAESAIEDALNGYAPSGQIELSFFQDPEAGNVIEEITALGDTYVIGRPIRFFVQPLSSLAEIHAPVHPPLLYATRTMTSVTVAASGPYHRSISLRFETVNANRNTVDGLKYTTADHAVLLGAANPSLSLMPADTYQEQPLFA